MGGERGSERMKMRGLKEKVDFFLVMTFFWYIKTLLNYNDFPVTLPWSHTLTSMSLNLL